MKSSRIDVDNLPGTEQPNIAAMAESAATSEQRRVAKQAAKMGHGAKPSDSVAEAEYDRLVAQAVELASTPALDFLGAKEKRLFLEKNMKKAENQCRRAIELDPDRPAAHYALGCALYANGDGTAAAGSFMAAMRLTADESTKEWANAATHAYAMLCANADAPRPEWWTDEALLELSERALATLPESSFALRWRADALSGLSACLPARTTARSAEQLRAASSLFQAAAKHTAAKDEKRSAVEAAAECLVQAKRLEAQATTPQVAGSGAGSRDDASREAAAEEAGDAGTTGAGGGNGKNAAKNRKKKEKAKQKLAEQLLQEVEGTVGAEAASGETAAAETAAGETAAETVAAETASWPTPPPPALATNAAAYRWADPLPASCLEALVEMGVVAGAPVSSIDLVGIAAEGGPEEAIAAGLIVPAP